jgi:hypothetical protein
LKASNTIVTYAVAGKLEPNVHSQLIDAPYAPGPSDIVPDAAVSTCEPEHAVV